MIKWIIRLLTVACLIIPVSADSFTAPVVPESATVYMPEETESFAQGLLYIFKTAIEKIRPEFSKTSALCLTLVAIVLLLSILNNFSKQSFSIASLTGAVVVGIVLLEPANSLINLGINTVVELSEYGKLLLPVMTAALAAQGSTTMSAAIYTGTVFFNTVLTSLIVKIIVPALYAFFCLAVTESAVSQELVKKMKEFIKWAMTWSLRCVLYIFTGYVSITGIISGSVDASALKATKLAISGLVPVVGGLLSDASESILVSAGVIKSTAGIYGIFAILAICVEPFLKTGILYILLKLTASICSVFSLKQLNSLIQDFSSGMGFILAMTGTVCILLLISIVCYLKGIGL